MKAAVIDRYGGPEVIQVRDVPVPVCRPGEVMVRVKAVSLNPVDCKIRRGDMSFIPGRKLPWIPGADFAGIVVQSLHEDFIEDDEVFGAIDPLRGGACAEYIVVSPENLYPKSDMLTYQQSAAIGIAGLTAMNALIHMGKIKTGDHVLINGCTGGVGFIALQIGKSMHANVTGICSTDNADFARKSGADKVLDYRKDNTGSYAAYDLIFDVHGSLSYSRMKHFMKQGGKFISLSRRAGVLLRSMYCRMTGSQRFFRLLLRPDRHDLAALTDMVEKKRIRPHITESYPLDHITAAHRKYEDGGLRGKIVLVP